MGRRVVTFLGKIGVFIEIHKYYIFPIMRIAIMINANIADVNHGILFSHRMSIIIKPKR